MNFNQLFDDLGSLFLEIKDSLIAFLPKFIFALIVLLIGYLIARLVQTLVRRFVRNTDRFIANQKLKSHLRNRDLEHSSIFISKTLYWIILVLFITLASEIMGMPVITAWLSGIVQYLPNIFAAIIIVFVGIIGGRLLADVILSATTKTGITYGYVLSKIVQYSILLITILIAIDQIGIDIALLTTILSVVIATLLFGAALSFGLGAKTSVSNILASYYLHNTYKEGDSVRINNVEGRIVQITSTAVILDTTDGQVSIPAKDFNEYTSVLIKKE
jgi:small-conductance mechanosensitive channel